MSINAEIVAVIDSQCSESGAGAWSVTIHIAGQPVYSASGSCCISTADEMQEAAHVVGLSWIAERFPDHPINLVVDGQECLGRSARVHLELFANRTNPPKSEDAWPILMKAQDVIPLKTAALETGKSDKTLRAWVRDFGIGRQSGPSAPIEISHPALEMVLHGDMAALELLRVGDRSSPRVVRFFRHLGIAP